MRLKLGFRVAGSYSKGGGRGGGGGGGGWGWRKKGTPGEDGLYLAQMHRRGGEQG